MHDSISTNGPQRPRVRRGLGVLAGVTLMATPLALAPAAQAQAVGGGPDTASTVATLLQGIIAGLPNTLANLLGGGSSPQTQCYKPDGLGSTLSCVVVPLDNAINPGTSRARAKVKATVRKGKVRSVRWVAR